jgi:starch-binding outer membrane protein SusE/F
MKNIKIVLFFIVLLGALGSCKKDENRIYFEGGKAPVLSASLAQNSVIPMSFATKDDEAIKFSWTNPDYMFTTGVSSQDVNYALEIDTTGANFTNPLKQTVTVSKDLSKSFTQGVLNDYLLNQLVLVPGMQHNLEMRVKATIGTNGSVPVYSNVLKYKITPYAIPPKVVPPASGKLFVTGSATPASWMGGGDPELISQKFTRVSNTLYVLNSITLTGGGSMLFVPQYGDWGTKYGFTGANNTNNVNGDDFKEGGGDILAPAATGTYKIEVDFQRGKFTVTKI